MRNNNNNNHSGISGLALAKSWEMEERLNRLEEKVFKTKRKPTTLSQQILILEKLGILNTIRKLDISINKKALLLSSLLNSDVQNTERFFSNAENTKTKGNYESIIEIFTKVGLKDEATKTERELDSLLKKKKEKKE